MAQERKKLFDATDQVRLDSLYGELEKTAEDAVEGNDGLSSSEAQEKRRLLECQIDLFELQKELADKWDCYAPAILERLRPVVAAAAGDLGETLNIVVGEAITAFAEFADKIRFRRIYLYRVSAEAKKSQFDAYKTAGFTEEQAFALLLASIKPADYASLLRSAKIDLNASKKRT